MINEKQGSNQLKVITFHLVINVFILLLHGYHASPTFSLIPVEFVPPTRYLVSKEKREANDKSG